MMVSGNNGKKMHETILALAAFCFILSVTVLVSPALGSYVSCSASETCRYKDTNGHLSECLIDVNGITSYTDGSCAGLTVFNVSLTSSARVDPYGSFITIPLDNESMPLLPADPNADIIETKLFLMPDSHGPINPPYCAMITAGVVEKIMSVKDSAVATSSCSDDQSITFTVANNSAVFNPSTGRISVKVNSISPSANVLFAISQNGTLVEVQKHTGSSVTFTSDHNFTGREARDLMNQAREPISLVIWTESPDRYAATLLNLKQFDDFYAEIIGTPEGYPATETQIPLTIENVGSRTDSYTVSVEPVPSSAWVTKKLSTQTVDPGKSVQLSVSVTPPNDFKNEAEIAIVIQSSLGVKHTLPLTLNAGRQVTIRPEIYVPPKIEVNKPFTANVVLNVNTTVDSNAYYYLYTDPFIKFDSDTGFIPLTGGLTQIKVNGTALSSCALSEANSKMLEAAVQIKALSELVREMVRTNDLEGLQDAALSISAGSELMWTIQDNEALTSISDFSNWIDTYISALKDFKDNKEGAEARVNTLKLEVHSRVSNLQQQLDFFRDKLFDENQGGGCSIVSSVNVNFGIMAMRNVTLASASTQTEITSGSLIGVKVRDEGGTNYVNPDDMGILVLRRYAPAQFTMFLKNNFAEDTVFKVDFPITTRLNVVISPSETLLTPGQEFPVWISVYDSSEGTISSETIDFTISSGAYVTHWPMNFSVKQMGCTLQTLDKTFVSSTDPSSFDVSLSNDGDVGDTYRLSLEGDAPAWLSLNSSSITIEPRSSDNVVINSNASQFNAAEGTSYSFMIHARSTRSIGVDCTRSSVVVPVGDVAPLLKRLNEYSAQVNAIKADCPKDDPAVTSAIQQLTGLLNSIKTSINMRDTKGAQLAFPRLDTRIAALKPMCTKKSDLSWIVIAVIIALIGCGVFVYFKFFNKSPPSGGQNQSGGFDEWGAPSGAPPTGGNAGQ